MCRNSWMAELDLEGPERNLSENNTYKKEERSADDRDSNLEEEMRDILTALKAGDEIGNLEEEEVSIIDKFAEVSERT